MRVGMIQSNYIPWRGYFDFVSDVNLFIFYDDVAYGQGRKWRNRNVIKTRKGNRWLTVPIESHHSRKQISDVRISYDQDWRTSHLNLLRQSYVNAPYYERYLPAFAAILREHHETISQLNIRLCRWIATELGFQTRFCLSSDFGVEGDKEHRPASIVSAAGGTTYVTGPNTRTYTDPELFARLGIRLEIKSYCYEPYPQLWGEFSPNVSILDLLFNTGPEAILHLRSKASNEIIDGRS